MANEVFIWGGKGNYKVNREILVQKKIKIIALFDNNSELLNPYNDIPLIGGEREFIVWINERSNPGDLRFLVTMGGGYGKIRIELQQFIKSHGPFPMVSIHATAYISPSAKIGEGSQIFAKSAICVESKIGKACIINTAASVDHECVLGDGVSIGPGVRLAGLVKVGNFSDINTGAMIFPKLIIGENVTIGAGSVVTKNIPDNVVVYGNPAKIIRKK